MIASAETGIAKPDQFRRELANVSTVDEAKRLRDLGYSAVETAKRLGFASKEQLAEAMALVLEAERKAGEMLAAMEKQKPGEYQRSHDDTVAPSLTDLGISKMQSHRLFNSGCPRLPLIATVDSTSVTSKWY